MRVRHAIHLRNVKTACITSALPGNAARRAGRARTHGGPRAIAIDIAMSPHAVLERLLELTRIAFRIGRKR
jgi:hypothetical protein